jgi:hypothetical protein
VTLVYAISTHAGFARYGQPDLQSLTGPYGSPQMIVWSYTLFVFVFALYLFDKLRGRWVAGKLLGAYGGESTEHQPMVGKLL